MTLDDPTLFNGATTHGLAGRKRLRHRCEIPLVWVSILATFAVAAAWVVAVRMVADGRLSGTYRLFRFTVDEILVVVGLAPLGVWVVRAILYARLRAGAVRMGPTQFPEGYRMVVEAADRFGLRKVPDAYVVLGNGTVNAFAVGHGFRRFVAVNSDAFEIGGRARDPDALRFVIGHEVGHIAAGHTSFVRILLAAVTSCLPGFGQAFSRSQEYTADNHGYDYAPDGAAGVIGLLSAGKYLGTQVNMHAMADRAATERGLWLHVAAWMSTHPVHTWRASALRDRARHGRLMIAPPARSAWFPPLQPSGSDRTPAWPTPAQALARLDAIEPATEEEQFGRYPGIAYAEPPDALRLASPNPEVGPPGAGPDGPGERPDRGAGADRDHSPGPDEDAQE